MLTVYNDGVGYPIANDNYYIRELASGLNEIVFEINIHDDNYPFIVEEASILDRDKNYYLVKQIDAGKETAKVVCQIDLDEWKSELLINYSNNSNTVAGTIESIKPDGWLVVDNSGKTIRRTIPSGDTNQAYNVTPFEVVQEACNVYDVRVIFNNNDRVIEIVSPTNYEPLGAFVIKDLNLKEINYKGKSQGFATRLYAYGKDDLSFADINDGLPYVDDNTYSNRIICAYWKDERYTSKENLLEDAKRKLHEMAVPQRSYDCDVIDLKATNPEMYGHQNFDLFEVITLMDNINKTAVNHQVVERWDYPHFPEKNKVVLSTSVPKIQSQISQISQSINSPTSTFQQIMNAVIQGQTDIITGNEGGYVILKDTDDDGKPDEILIMDTESTETAVNVIRMNKSGIGFSTTGYNGPFRTAWTIDGKFTADNITGGTMRAGSIDGVNISGSNIKSANNNYLMNLWAATLSLYYSNNLKGIFYTQSGGANGILKLFNGTATSATDFPPDGSALTVMPFNINITKNGNKVAQFGMVSNDSLSITRYNTNPYSSISYIALAEDGAITVQSVKTGSSFSITKDGTVTMANAATNTSISLSTTNGLSIFINGSGYTNLGFVDDGNGHAVLGK